MLDGDRILFADIDISVLAAHGIGAEQHPFHHGMGVAFQNGAIHKCAGVAFVRVADGILGTTIGLAGEFPFETGGETGAAAASEFGSLNLIDHLFGR